MADTQQARQLCEFPFFADAVRYVADHEQILNRQGPKFCFNFLGEKGDAFIRFFQLACHFRQKLIGADADIDGKAKLCKDALLNGFCGFDWSAKQGFLLYNPEILHLC